MTQHEVARRMRFTLSQQNREPNLCELIGAGYGLVAVALAGYLLGAWWYDVFFGGQF